MANRIVLYHTCPVHRARAILRSGILPALSQGAREESWLHSFARLEWARAHTRDRHQVRQVVSLRLSVPRDWLTRRCRGVWTCNRPITPDAIQAVNIVALIGQSAA